MKEKKMAHVARRYLLTTGKRRRTSFDLTPTALEILGNEAEKRNMTKVMLLELMIRDYFKQDAA